MRVTVYEGEVALSASGSTLELAAGTAGWLWAGGTPRRLDPEATAAAPRDPTRADSVHAAPSTNAAQTPSSGRVAAARDHDDGNWAPSTGPARDDDDHGSWIAPSQERLLALAKRCALRWDIPAMRREPRPLSDDRARELELSSDERNAYDRVLADLNAQVMTELRALYLEVTGDVAGAGMLTPQAMAQEVLDKSPDPLIRDAAWKLSHERAGLMPLAAASTLTAATPVERLLRMIVSLGDTFERQLGQVIGVDRAHALRVQRDGWDTRSMTAPGCPDSR
jgi:hypothetical protein